MDTLQTERLLLRPFELADAAFFQQLVNTPGWLRFIGDRNIHTLQSAENYLQERILSAFEQNGYGALVMVNTYQEPVGMCGLFKRDALEFPDIGYALLPEHEGQGYAVEAATTVLKWALEELKFPKILAITNPDNERSQALLEKIGLVYEKRIRLSADEEELCLFGTKTK